MEGSVQLVSFVSLLLPLDSAPTFICNEVNATVEINTIRITSF